jgi:hypothetical protein
MEGCSRDLKGRRNGRYQVAIIPETKQRDGDLELDLVTTARPELSIAGTISY